MTCIKKRLRIAYENIAFYGNKTWINDCLHYTRMNQELYARECKLQESDWTDLTVRRPRTVQDVIPNSKLAVYLHSCTYNACRELSYRPTLSFDITFHYPCLRRHGAYNEPWMLPEVEELFMRHTCVDTFNFLCYKRLEDLPNLDFVDAIGDNMMCCPLDEGFHEISPLLEDVFDRTPGQPPCIPGGVLTTERPCSDAGVPPLYKVTTLDEMLMKMKLRFGNIRQIWSVSKGGTCPDRAMKVFKSPFKTSFVREKHQFDIKGIELFTIFPHGRDARRLRNLREIRSIQKLAEAIKDFKKSLKQIKYQQSTAMHHHHNSHSISQDTPSLIASEEAATSSAATPTARRLYSDVVQGLSSIHHKTPPSIKSSDYYSTTECTSTPANSSARESYISISPPVNCVVSEVSSVSSPLAAEDFEQQLGSSSQHSIASSSYNTHTSSASDLATSQRTNINYNMSLHGSSRIVENSTATPFLVGPQCGSYSNGRQQQQIPLPQQHHHQQMSTCFYPANSYAPNAPNHNNATISFCPSSFYQQSAAVSCNNYNYSNPPQQICHFRGNQQTQQAPIQTRTYQNQTAIPTSSTWVLTSHPQFTQPNAVRNNSVFTVSNFSPQYFVMPQGATVVKTNDSSANSRCWQLTNQQQQQYNQRPSITIPPPMPQQPVYHQQQTATPTLWQHVNQTQGTIYRTTPSPQIIIEEPRRKQTTVAQQQCLPSTSRSSTTILSKPSCSNSKPQLTSILINPNSAIEQQQRRVASSSRLQQEDIPSVNFPFRGGGSIVITSRSDDLERQALAEYHPSNETLLTEIERLAEEQYESSSENWRSPPSSETDFLSRFQSDRGALVILFAFNFNSCKLFLEMKWCIFRFN